MNKKTKLLFLFILGMFVANFLIPLFKSIFWKGI